MKARRITRVGRWLVVCLLVAPIWTASAADQGSPARADLERAFLKKQYAGWGGIVLRCLHDKTSKLAERVCDNIRTDAAFLAAASKVPFYAVKGDPYFEAALARLEKVQEGLILTAEVNVADSDVVGIAVRFAAGNFYSQAVDTSETKGPQALPKGGTLVLWDRSMVAVGAEGSELINSVRGGTESILKSFLTEFINNWTQLGN
jgi:hypothetical protein